MDLFLGVLIGVFIGIDIGWMIGPFLDHWFRMEPTEWIKEYISKEIK